MDLLQKYEERRIEFIKYTMQKFLRYYSECNTILLQREDKFSDSVKMINSFTDLQIFVDENKIRMDKDSLLCKATVEHYEPRRVSIGGNAVDRQNSISSAEADDFVEVNYMTKSAVDKAVQFVKDKIREMIRTQKELTMDEKAEIINHLQNKDVNFRVTEELKMITDVKEYHVLRCLAEIVNIVITESINDKHNEFIIINNILMTALAIYCRKTPEGFPQAKKVYLADLIKGHAIWSEPARWKTWIYCIIEDNKRKACSKKKKIVIDKFKKLKEESSEEYAYSGMLTKFLSKITRPMANSELDQRQKFEIEAIEEEGKNCKSNINVIFNVLSSY